MAQLDSKYCEWLGKNHLWKDGQHLFADDESEQEIKRIALQISRNNDVSIIKRKYKGTEIFLLYSNKSTFSVVPTSYYYMALDAIEGTWLSLSDVISMYRGGELAYGS